MPVWYSFMPRTARHAPGGLAYHVLNRASGRLRLFKKAEDYLAFERARRKGDYPRFRSLILFALLQQDGTFCEVLRLWYFRDMFVYSPPKASIWGHALRPKDPQKAAEGLQRFFETYFEGPYQLDPSGAYELSWRESALPNIDWDPSLLLPENERFKKASFLMSSLTGERVSFPLGLLIPVSPYDPASYEFLKNFCREAPFMMSAKHFKVGMPSKKGKLKYVKATGETAARLAIAMQQS